MSQCPEVIVEIHADDGLVDIVEAGFDAGIRFGESLQKDMIAVRIGPDQRMVAIAAPSFLTHHAPPTHPRDLIGLPCIALRFAGGTLYRWEFEKDGVAIKIDVSGPLILNDNRLVLEAVAAGLGVGFVIERMAEEALAREDVVRILEDWCPTFPGFFLYYPSRRQMRPALRAFIDAFARG